MRTSIQLTGTLTGPAQGVDRPPAKYVYQKTKPGLGNITTDPLRRMQCRIWTRGTIVNTPAQQPNRATFATGVATWHTLTDEQKEAYRAPARAKKLNRFQFFMQQYLNTTTAPTHTVWDGGTTAWDSGSTTWEAL